MLKKMRETDAALKGDRKNVSDGTGADRRQQTVFSHRVVGPGTNILLTDASDIFFQPTTVHHDL